MIGMKFNEGWNVSEKQGTFGMVVEKNVRNVTLPFDAMLQKERIPNESYFAAYYPRGIWEYKKTFFVPAEDEGRKLFLQFDGVFEKSLIYINEDLAGQRAYGYSQFLVDTSGFIKYGEENEIKVQVHLNDSSRWYSGAGIYRDVYLLKAPMIYICPKGVKVKTLQADGQLAVLEAEITLKNESLSAKKTLRIKNEIRDEAGQVIAGNEIPVTLFQGKETVARAKMYIERPLLWSDEAPNLYTYCTKLCDGENVIDENIEQVGIRTLGLSTQKGLTVNGKEVKLRGACIHHDNGPVGSVSMESIEERRVSLLKRAGFNAIRTAHNPASPALLSACDRIGMYVMEETFDAWSVNKVNFDYALDFSKCWEEDVKSLVDKSFNHPSVIMYAIGNEIPDTGTPNGSIRSRMIVDKLKELDSTRYTINAINGMVSVMSIMTKMFQDSQEKMAQAKEQGAEMEGQAQINTMMTGLGNMMKQVMKQEIVGTATEEAYSCVDIAGYNYMDSRYEMDRQMFPNRVICGSETFPADIDQNWRKVMDNTNIIGDFTWTGWDYIGEVGIGLNKYEAVPPEYGTSAPYPCLTAMCGDISISGYRRPISYYREIVFGLRKLPYIAVCRPDHHGQIPADSPWCWSDSVSSWSFEASVGKPVKVEVYSDAEEVELLLNGKSLGKQPAGEANRFIGAFETIYMPGELTAVAYKEGREVGSYSLQSVKDNVKLVAQPEKTDMSFGKNEVIYLPIQVQDEEGVIDVLRNIRVSLSIDGPGELIGFGTDDPLTEENFYDMTRTLYDGRALAVLRPTGIGTITVAVTADDFMPAKAVVSVKH